MAAGLKVYQEQCIHCHGENGNLKRGGAKDLTVSQLDMAGVKNLILNGKGNMAAYKSVLSPAEVEAVATYVMAYRK
jgi:mono/diheme cytochrome c family protein